MALPVIPIIFASNVNSDSPPDFYAWEGYTECGNINPITLYSGSGDDSLELGVIMYEDAGLVGHVSNVTLYLSNGYIYYTNSSGEISAISRCNEAYNATISCGSVTPVQVYAAFGSTLQVGTVIYADDLLTDPFESSEFVVSGIRYVTDSSGWISSLASCPAPFTIYTNCSSESPSTVVYSRSTPSTNGSLLYSDVAGTVELATRGFVYPNQVTIYQYTQSPGSGVTYVGECST
jgi:hypothetical protein